MSLSFPDLLVIVAVCGAAYLLSYIRKHRARLPLPPGPPNRQWLNRPHVFLRYKAWAEEYGPVFSFKNGFETIVVITGYQETMEIMERQGAHLEGRPRRIASGEILSRGMRLLLMGGPRVKKYRKALHAQLNATAAREYRHIQVQNAEALVTNIMNSPDEHQDHAKAYAASTILNLTYGRTTPASYSDPEVQKINDCIQHLSAASSPGRYFVENFPWMRYLPRYTAELDDHHQQELTLFRAQLAESMNPERQGSTESGVIERPSFGRFLMTNQTKLELSVDELAYLAGSMFGAGSDTTASAISFAIMAAALFPDCQRKVQAQLEEVMRAKGPGSHPDFEDEEALSEVTAFYQETLRWRPNSPDGFAHMATKDIYWNGYIIPKGTTVFGCHWLIARSPDIFPDPEEFKPQRWFDAGTGTIRKDIKSFVFGFGRRSCPGAHVASNSLFITLANIFWTFDISKSSTDTIDPLAITPTMNIHPKPFSVCFKRRLPKEAGKGVEECAK